MATRGDFVRENRIAATIGRDTTAAIYARKSNEQRGVSEEQKSVARQIDHGTKFAQGRGWTIPADFVFVDDGISGAEFAKRPGVQALRTAAGKYAPFSKVIVPDLDRVGRESVETAMLLKDLDEAGVEIWTYLDGQQIRLDSPTDVLLMQVRNYANAMQLAATRKHVLDALHRKGDAGYSTGAKTYGYRSQRVDGPDGKYSHAIKVPIDAEVAIVRRIFDRALTGAGSSRIARELNTDGIPAPKGGEFGWNPATVDDILERPLYKGVAVYGKTRKKNKWGAEHYHRLPRADWRWMPGCAPAIVDPAVWDAVAAMKKVRSDRLKANGGGKGGMLRDGESKYTFSGFARCAECGGTMFVKPRRKSIRDPGGLVYACSSYQRGWARAGRKCTNATRVPIGAVDDAIVSAILNTLRVHFDPAHIADRILADLERRQSQAGVARLKAEIKRVERERDNLARAIARAKNPDAVVDQLNAREDDLSGLRTALDAATRQTGITLPTRAKLVRDIAGSLDGLTTSLSTRNVRAIRTLLRQALVGGAFQFTVAPAVTKRTRINGTNTGRFEITGQLDAAPVLHTLAGIDPHSGARGTPHTKVWIMPIRTMAA